MAPQKKVERKKKSSTHASKKRSHEARQKPAMSQAVAKKPAPELHSDSDEDGAHHENLLEAVISTNRKRPAQRDEPAAIPSEYNLSKPEGTELDVDDLLSSLKNSKQFNVLSKRLKVVREGSKKLEPPLPQVHAEKLQRRAVYQETSTKAAEWLPTIKRNRKADHLFFTHQEGKPLEPSLNQLVESHKPRTPLEQEIAVLLGNSDYAVPNPSDGLTKAERRSLDRLALQEAKQRRRELLATKSLLFYQERRFRREKKIKSKMFHRVRRKRKEKLEAASQEGISQEDADKALLGRAEERMTLKHSSQSKWAKKLKRTNNSDLKQLVSDVHQIGQELRERKAEEVPSDSDSSAEELYSEDGEEVEGGGGARNHGNPWLSATGRVKTVGSSPKALSTQPTKSNLEGSDSGDDDGDDDEQEVGGRLLGDGSEQEAGLSDSESGAAARTSEQPQVDPPLQVAGGRSQERKRRTIDIGKVLVMDVDSEGGDKMAAASDQLLNIRSAFANDDVVEEFVKEKDQLEHPAVPTALEQPGWGHWAGQGTKPPKRRTRPSKMAAKPPRQDANLRNVIISEERDNKFAKHQVSKVPFPFQSRNQFEKAGCHPIGPQWNSTSVFHDLTRPRILTETGVAIAPIKRPDQ